MQRYDHLRGDVTVIIEDKYLTLAIHINQTCQKASIRNGYFGDCPFRTNDRVACLLSTRIARNCLFTSTSSALLSFAH